jgi:dihydroorotate dehydrogenase
MMDKYRVIHWSYTKLLKPIFFLFDPELVHNSISKTGKILGKFRLTRFLTKKLLNYDDQILEQTVAGLRFRNPVGLSAGFDKNADLLNILPEVGFGFMEIGSVTTDPYKGNPKPRLFRLPKSKALVVYYGLMNIGVKAFVQKFRKYTPDNAIAGISIAKTNSEKTAKEQNGIQDYFDCMQYLEREKIGDYYTINISCPNTFGGEPFTTEAKLEKLLSKISTLHVKKPIFIKMPINLELADYDSLVKVAIKYKMTGVIIGNLTKIRDEKLIKDLIPEHVKGGISGLPTQKLSNELISYTYQNYSKDLIVIGTGGIFSAADAYEKIKRGASLVQLITGMIFEGPQLIGQINKELASYLRADGYKNIREAVGANYNKA